MNNKSLVIFICINSSSLHLILYVRLSLGQAIDGDLEVAAGALCSLHLYCSHYSPLNTEPLRQSAVCETWHTTVEYII